MALVGDDDVEGMDRDVESIGILVDRLIAEVQDSLATEEVERDALDRRDIDEGEPGLGIEQVRGRQCGRVERGIVAHVVMQEPLAIELVDLVKLEAGLRLERGERADGLGGEGAPIDEKEDPLGKARLHEPIGLVEQVGERTTVVLEITAEHLREGVGSVEGGDLPRAVQRVPDVVEPRNFAVGRVQEGNAKFAEA